MSASRMLSWVFSCKRCSAMAFAAWKPISWKVLCRLSIWCAIYFVCRFFLRWSKCVAISCAYILCLTNVQLESQWYVGVICPRSVGKVCDRSLHSLSARSVFKVCVRGLCLVCMWLHKKCFFFRPMQFQKKSCRNLGLS